MKIVDLLVKIKRCVDLELEVNLDIVKFSLENGVIAFEISNQIEKDLRDTWMKDYLVDWNWIGENSSTSKVFFSEKIIEAEAIVNFDQYYASKKGIKKFNL
jgi:hypothetical protein